MFVVVVSTTGDGEPPDTVTKFWRRLKKKTLPRDHLSQCKYALLGKKHDLCIVVIVIYSKSCVYLGILNMQ